MSQLPIYRATANGWQAYCYGVYGEGATRREAYESLYRRLQNKFGLRRVTRELQSETIYLFLTD